MDTIPPQQETEPVLPTAPKSVFRVMFEAVRARIISGLLFMLPIVITFWIVFWIYSTLQRLFLDPAAEVVNSLMADKTRENLPYWWQTYVSPVLAVALALGFLYVLGYFVRSRLSRALDWVLLRVPGVMLVYKAVSNLFQSLQSTGGGPTFKRVVMVAFPHPGSRALAFVTKTLRDSGTGEAILCVWVLTGVMPPAGFVLFVPEKDVTDVPWTVNETLQIILSGGITAPLLIPYTFGAPAGLIIPHSAAERSAEPV